MKHGKFCLKMLSPLNKPKYFLIINRVKYCEGMVERTCANGVYRTWNQILKRAAIAIFIVIVYLLYNGSTSYFNKQV